MMSDYDTGCTPEYSTGNKSNPKINKIDWLKEHNIEVDRNFIGFQQKSGEYTVFTHDYFLTLHQVDTAGKNDCCDINFKDGYTRVMTTLDAITEAYKVVRRMRGLSNE